MVRELPITRHIEEPQTTYTPKSTPTAGTFKEEGAQGCAMANSRTMSNSMGMHPSGQSKGFLRVDGRRFRLLLLPGVNQSTWLLHALGFWSGHGGNGMVYLPAFSLWSGFAIALCSRRRRSRRGDREGNLCLRNSGQRIEINNARRGRIPHDHDRLQFAVGGREQPHTRTVELPEPHTGKIRRRERQTLSAKSRGI